MITVLTIGRKHEAWIEPGLERYQKRLRAPWDVRWELLPHSSLEGARARQEESERILSRLDPSDVVILLDETGTALDSPRLSKLFDEHFARTSQRIVCVIGGAYGVSDELKQRAQYIISLSNLVFPHQLVRLILIEQFYRCQEISRGGSYHHGL